MLVDDSRQYNVPDSYLGVWQRLDGNGASPRTFWVQTRRLYASIVIPAEREFCAGKFSLNECSDDELLKLAGQEGVAGSCIVEGEVLHRRRQIDYQTTRGKPFIRRIQADGEQLQEETTAGTGRINWHRISGQNAEVIAFRFQDENAADMGVQRRGLLLVVGDYFIFVRDRTIFVPHSESLEDYMECKDFTHDELVALLDFEVSFGVRSTGNVPWEIRLSTLPLREGQPLFKAGEFDAIAKNAGRLPQRIRQGGETFMRRWSLDEWTNPAA